MDLQLAGKVAWVTGGSGGIGSAIAAALATEGADVAITGRTLQTLEETGDAIAAASGRRVIAVPADVTNSEAVVEAAATVAGRLGGIDILVNSAATPGGQTGASFETVTDQQVLRDLDEKLVSTLRTCQAAVPYMKERGWGRLIHVGGLGARRSGSYSSARTLALVHLSKTLSDELGPHGITSNVVHPGATHGRWLAESLAARSAVSGVSESELEAEFASASAIRRLLDPEEIAYVVAFLASPLSAAVTGESIGTGGGSGREVTI
jgi:NAD(P)-dependent dehydrogenase (short-subunit alcohol dehydrogenase family)